MATELESMLGAVYCTECKELLGTPSELALIASIVIHGARPALPLSCVFYPQCPACKRINTVKLRFAGLSDVQRARLKKELAL